MLLRDGRPVLVIPVPTLTVATLLPVVVTLLAAG
jgi:hypothetical protein